MRDKTERNAEMQRLYDEDGLTLEEIGTRHGISRERVRQLISTDKRMRVVSARYAIDRRLSSSPYQKEKKDWLAGERVISRVRKEPNGCWEWLGARGADGRAQVGRMRVARLFRTCQAARVFYEIYRGHPEDGKQVLHTCDNPACVNPEHLYLGTPQDNVDDREERQRANRAARFTDEEVGAMRAMHSTGISILAISRRLETTYARTYRAVVGKSYKSAGA